MKVKTGTKMKAWRDERGLSQLDAAKGAKISQSEWQKLESGRSSNPSHRTVRRVVAYMGGTLSHDDFADSERLPKAAAPPPESSTDAAADVRATG